MRRERRQRQRVRERNQVAVTVLASDKAPELVDMTFFCPTADISETGLRLRLHVSVPVDTEMALRIAFRRPVRAFKHEGRVIWARSGNFEGHPYAVGVQFTHLQNGTTETWQRMLNRKVSEADASSLVPPQ